MPLTLTERLRAHERQKSRLAAKAAKLKDAERRQHTRRLIEAGGWCLSFGNSSLPAPRFVSRTPLAVKYRARLDWFSPAAQPIFYRQRTRRISPETEMEACSP